ncbi:MAG TPA: hypothetical protein VFW98_12825 [Gemmatimonadaceae bacterium]|nr:hypothetical protein [Gemmatimonadaceae bacterium]
MSSRLLACWRMLLTLGLLLSAAACDRVDVGANLGPGGGSNTLLGQSASAVIGHWSNVATTTGAPTGTVTQTTWEFADAGMATRTITTLTALGAILNSSTTVVRWQVGAGVMTLRFGAPSFRILRLSYSIDYDAAQTTLFLGGMQYRRVDS